MKRWLALTFLLVFGAGVALGVFGVEYFSASPAGSGQGSAVSGTSRSWWGVAPEIPMYLVTNEEVYKELGLSPIQREEIAQLLATYHERVRQARGTLAAVSKQLRQDVDGLLAREQRERLAAIQERYSEREFQQRAERELAYLRSEIALEATQEARVFQILFDSARERRQLFRHKSRPERSLLRQQASKICARRDSRLKDVLNDQQFAAYEAYKKRERDLHQRCRSRGRAKARKEAAPTATPRATPTAAPVPGPVVVP